MDRHDRLEALISPTIEAMGYDLVRVQLQGKEHLTLQIMAERRDGIAMTVDDCADISRALSAVLDVEDPISGAYNLEVSSPGIDRPLTREKDFVNWAGFEAKIETAAPVAGRKRFRGRLKGLDDAKSVLLLSDDGEELALPFADIHRAKLVLTDDLIEAAMKEQEG